MSLLRNLCFTINNYTETDYENILDTPYSYVICGFEVGKDGTPHIQGYMELKKRTRFNTIKGYLPRAHIEARRGTQEQAIKYCKKDGNYVEDGVKNEQGHRTDLDRCRTLAMEGGMREVTAICSATEIRVAEKFLTYNEEPRDHLTEVIWISGPAGSGKSKLARELTSEMDTYTKNTNNKWFDGYDGHEAVIMDDFRDSWFSITETLSLLDRYEKRVEFKGGWRQFKPKTIVVTSIKKPNECYLGLGEPSEQLLRRITKHIELVPNVPEVDGNTMHPLQI